MKTIIRALAGPVIIGLMMLVTLASPVSAHPRSSGSISLPKSPVSASTLVAQAIHAGKIHPKGRAPARPNVQPSLTCTPRPCALPNVQASEGGAPVNEVPIASNPTNANDLLTGGNDYNCPNIQGFYASITAGSTWNTHCMDNLPGQFGEGDPGVGYDRHGTLYITGIDSPNGSTGEIIFQKSTNNGTTWSAPAVAVNPLFPGGLTDKDWLQVDNNTPTSPHVNCLYISVTQFDTSSNSEISVSHSCDGGATWTTVGVDTPQLFPNVDQFSDLAIGSDGTVYATWMRCAATGPTGDCGGTTATLVVSKSTDGGNTWSAPTTIATPNLAPDTCGAFYGCLPNTGERVSEIPATDIDRSREPFHGYLYTVMYNWTGTFMQVLVSTSANGGATWGAPVSVAPASDTHDQFFPWLTVGPSGDVGVSWLDRRNDPSNISYEAFGAFSAAGGGTWASHNLQLAPVPSNPFNDGFGGGFMGDYTGNYWTNVGSMYASWMDTRNGSDCQDEVGGMKVRAT